MIWLKHLNLVSLVKMFSLSFFFLFSTSCAMKALNAIQPTSKTAGSNENLRWTSQCQKRFGPKAYTSMVGSIAYCTIDLKIGSKTLTDAKREMNQSHLIVDPRKRMEIQANIAATADQKIRDELGASPCPSDMRLNVMADLELVFCRSEDFPSREVCVRGLPTYNMPKYVLKTGRGEEGLDKEECGIDESGRAPLLAE